MQNEIDSKLKTIAGSARCRRNLVDSPPPVNQNMLGRVVPDYSFFGASAIWLFSTSRLTGGCAGAIS
jgi:hypothetical protein